MKSILVIQTAFLGDIVMTTPLLRELRRVHPDSRIIVLTTPSGRQVLQGLSFVDDVVAYDKRAGIYGLRGLARAIVTLRRKRFDLGIAAQRSFRSGFLLRWSVPRPRIGFEGAAGAWAYDTEVRWDPDRHAVHRYLALSAPVGGDPAAADAAPELAVLDENLETVAHHLRDLGVSEHEPVVCISPGSVWATKRWLPDGYADVARAVADLGCRPVLIGGVPEIPLCESIAVRSGRAAVVMAGRTKLSEVTALLSRSRALVTNDSGPAHVAVAVGTPVVAVFGPTVPSMGFAPLGDDVRIVERAGLECRPCDRHGPRVCPLGHFRCMREIGADRVISELRAVLR